MTKTRVPDSFEDERAMRAFYDSLDRKHLKTGQLEDLATSPTTDEIAAKLNALLAIFRER